MNKMERIRRIEAALEKLRASELNRRQIVRRYLNLESVVNKQMKTKNGEGKSRLAVKQSSSSFSKMTISGASSTTVNSLNSRKGSRHDLLQKRIFHFHDELGAINDISSKRNSRKKAFLNALEKTNLDVWKSNTIKYPVRKLEIHMDSLT